MLSVAYIVKNEEAILEKSLESVKSVDEIIIVDTGSTDKTVKIAEKYGKVYTDYNWNDDFAEARNYALNRCHGDWILIMDADHYCPKGFIERVKQELNDMGDFTSLECKLVWEGNPNCSHKLPIVIKKGIQFIGKIHEYVITNKKPTSLYVTYGKSPTHDTDPDRNLRILLTDTDNPRSMFYLAHEYQDRKDWTNAIKWYKKYLKVGTWRYELADANLSLARCLWNLSRGDEARQACLQAILGNPNFKEAFNLMSEMSWNKEAMVWRRFAEVTTNEDVLFVR